MATHDASVDAAARRSLFFAPPEPSLGESGLASTGRALVPVGPGRPVVAAPHLSGHGPALNQFPIQLAKVQRPPLRDETLQRDRLLDWLGAKIHHRVLLVTAEAGYGKTTLLADFARRSRHRILWYRLDEEDRNWVSFLNYLVAAGRTVIPGFAPSTASLLQELGTSSVTRDTVVETFLHEVNALGDTTTVLVLDDYHVVDDVADIQSIVRPLLSRAPESLSIVIASRRQPSFPLARLRALGELAELSREDLRFDQAETDRLFRETFGRTLEPDVLADLTHRTEGWVASLQLVQSALRDRSVSEVRRFVRNLNGASGEMYDYLAEEVVGDLDGDTQHFLMRTSILQMVTAELADLLTGLGRSRVEQLMESCEHLGLLTPGEAGRDEHRYHPLVQSFLQARLVRDIGDQDVSELHRTVARHGEARDWRLAAYHFAAAGDASDLHRVLKSAIPAIMGSGQFELAESYVDRFPSDAPVPAFEMVRSRMALHRGNAEAALSRARAAFEGYGDQEGSDTDLALLNLITVHYNLDMMAEAASLVSVLLERKPQGQIKDMALGTQLVLESSLDGDLGSCLALLLEMERDQRSTGQIRYVGITKLNMALARMTQGSVGLALSDATEAVQALSESSSSCEMISARMARAWALAHSGRWEETTQELDRGLLSTHPLVRFEVLREAADLHVSYGDPGTARQLLEEAAELARNSLVRMDQWILSAALNALQDRRIEEAEQLLARVRSGMPSPIYGNKARHLAVKALFHVVRGDTDARHAIESASAHALTQGAFFWLHFVGLLEASIDSADRFNAYVRRLSDTDSAYLSILAERVCLRLPDLEPSALEAVIAEAHRRPVRWRPALRAAIEDGSTPTKIAAARLLDQVGTVEDIGRLRALSKSLKGIAPDAALGRRLARSLAARAFVEDQNRVSIRVGDQMIPGTEVRRKVLALLCFLLTRSGFSATKDQVLDALWPELEPEIAVNSLNQTVYFLRRVFEPRYREQVSPGYVHHDSDVLWLDGELVTSRSAQCLALLRGLTKAASPAEVDELTAMYRGRFALDFAYEDWSARFRDTLHAAYLEVVERAVNSDMSLGHFDRAIRVAQRVLTLEPETEQVELVLLRLYKLAGASSAAAEQYSHYATAMRNDLGIEPPSLGDL